MDLSEEAREMFCYSSSGHSAEKDNLIFDGGSQ